MAERPVGTIASNSQEQSYTSAEQQQIQANGGQHPFDQGTPDERGEQLMQLLSELQAKAHIRERPFVSDKPIIGRLIVFVREKWNSVAAKWYVRPMMHQQNTFNQAVVQVTQELLEAIRAMHDELDQRVINGDRDVTLLARKIAEGEYRLRQWEERAAKERAELAQQLSRLEEMLATREGGDQGEEE
jgi:septin family protein